VPSGTQEDLIAAAQQLMLRHGYAATGINDICQQAGVSKGAFYHSFPSKEALALAALSDFYRRGAEELLSIDVSAAPPADRLPLFVERVADRALRLWERGCLIGGLATEVALVSDDLQRSVAQQFDELAGVVAGLAGPFVASLPGAGLTAAGLADDFLALVEGAIVLSRAHRDPRRVRAALKRHAASLRLLQRGQDLPSTGPTGT
jgi:TetR/AcrR family transcriptional regulator, transcriptional repressor for nem operon